MYTCVSVLPDSLQFSGSPAGNLPRVRGTAGLQEGGQQRCTFELCRSDAHRFLGNNVLNLLSTLPGLRINPLGDTYNNIGGLGINTINTTRDGLSIVDGRIDPQNITYSSGYGAFFIETAKGQLKK